MRRICSTWPRPQHPLREPHVPTARPQLSSMHPHELRSPSAKSPPRGASRPEISSSALLQATGHPAHLEVWPREPASLRGDNSHRHQGLISQLKDTDRSAAGSFPSVLLGDTHLEDGDSGPGESVHWKRQPLKTLSNPGKGPYRVLLTHSCADKSKGVNSRIRTSHKKGTPHHKWTSTAPPSLGQSPPLTGHPQGRAAADIRDRQLSQDTDREGLCTYVNDVELKRPLDCLYLSANNVSSP